MFATQRQALRNAWLSRSASDRRVLTILAAVGVPALLIGGLLLPAQRAQQAALQENQQANQLLSEMRQYAPTMSGLSGVSSVSAAVLPQRVQLLASNTGLALERMESDPAGVRLAMNNVKMASVMAFFQQCRGQGIRILEAQITRDASTNSNQLRLRVGV